MSSTRQIATWKQTLGMDELSGPFGTCPVTTQMPSSGEEACTGIGKKCAAANTANVVPGTAVEEQPWWV